MHISHPPHFRRDERRFLEHCHNQGKEYWICVHESHRNWFEGCCGHNPCSNETGICNDPDMEYDVDYVLKEDVKPDPWQEAEPRAPRPNDLGPQLLSQVEDKDGGPPPLGAILGGILGGVAAIFIIGALIYLWRGRKKPSEKDAAAAAAVPTINTNVNVAYHSPGGYSELYSPPPTLSSHKRTGSVPGYSELQSPLNTVSSRGGITPDMTADGWTSEQWPYPSPHPESAQATYRRISGGHSVDMDVHPAYAELPVHNFDPVELAGDTDRSPIEYGGHRGLGLEVDGHHTPSGYVENPGNGEEGYTLPTRVTPQAQAQGMRPRDVDSNVMESPDTPLLERR